MVPKTNFDELFYDNLMKQIVFESHVSGVLITGTTAEYLIFCSLKESGCEHINWKQNSHRQDFDINGLSVKTCKIIDGELKISSHRTTKFPSLEEKILFLNEQKEKFSDYVVFGKKENKKLVEYSIYIIPNDFFIYNIENWKENYNKKNQFIGWKTGYVNGIKMIISKAMSDQLWIHIQEDKLSKYLFLNKIFNIQDLGKKRGEYLNDSSKSS